MSSIKRDQYKGYWEEAVQILENIKGLQISEENTKIRQRALDLCKKPYGRTTRAEVAELIQLANNMQFAYSYATHLSLERVNHCLYKFLQNYFD